ncbi:MAG: restriction endonuclease [Nitrospiraceae bacterium]|nr:restriction endonuclease [Nitrospiraceae bacterium]
MRQAKGPEFTRFTKPILKVLSESGGSGTPSEIVDRAIELAGISEQEQEAVNKNGQSRIKNQVHWARQYLVWADFIDSSKRGVWSLTDKGRSTDIDKLNALELFKDVQKKRFQSKSLEKPKTPSPDETLPEDTEIQNHRVHLIELVRSLSPEGFERLSQRLLRESGFQHVTVTGRSGDGGIDGIGTLQINPFVSFNVLFQCKRYQGTVTPSQVRDFRGAMMGRADKGIIITTGTFTVEAKKEARRDGVPPIELVDGDLLVDMFEKLELGLIPKLTYDIDENFFNDYRK